LSKQSTELGLNYLSQQIFMYNKALLHILRALKHSKVFQVKFGDHYLRCLA